MACLLKRSQSFIIVFPGSHTVCVNLIGYLKLCPEIGSIHIAWKIGRAGFHPGIFVYLTPEKLTPVGSLLADNLSFFRVLRVADKKASAFTHTVVFRLVEAETAVISDGSEGFPFVGGHDALSGILNHNQIMTFCDIHNSIHLTAHAGIMYRNDCSGFFSDGIFNERLINIHGIRTDIHKYRCGTTQNKGIGGGNKSIGWHDDFISRFNVRKKCSHLCSMGTGSGQQSLGGAGTVFNPLIAAFGEFTIAADFVVLYRLCHIFRFFACERRNIKINHKQSFFIVFSLL